MAEKIPAQNFNKIQLKSSPSFGKSSAATKPEITEEDQEAKKKKEGLLIGTGVALAAVALGGAIYYKNNPEVWAKHKGKIQGLLGGSKNKQLTSSVESTPSPTKDIPVKSMSLEKHSVASKIKKLADDKHQYCTIDGYYLQKEGSKIIVTPTSLENASPQIVDYEGNILGYRKIINENVYEDVMNGCDSLNYRPYTEKVVKTTTTKGVDGCKEYLRIYADGDTISKPKVGDRSVILKEWRRENVEGNIVERHLVKKTNYGNVVKVQKYNSGKKVASYTARGGALEDINNVTDPSKIIKYKEYRHNNKRVVTNLRDSAKHIVGLSTEIYNYDRNATVDKTGAVKSRFVQLIQQNGKLGDEIYLPQDKEAKTMSDAFKSAIKTKLESLKTPESKNLASELKLEEYNEQQLAELYTGISNSNVSNVGSKIGQLKTRFELAGKVPEDLQSLKDELSRIKAEELPGPAGTTPNPLAEEIDKILKDLEISRDRTSGVYNFSKSNSSGLFVLSEGKSSASQVKKEQVYDRLKEYYVTLIEKRATDPEYSDPLLPTTTKKGRFRGTKTSPGSIGKWEVTSPVVSQVPTLDYSSAVAGSKFGILNTTGTGASAEVALSSYSKVQADEVLKPADALTKVDNTKVGATAMLCTRDNSVAYPDKEIGLKHNYTIGTISNQIQYT